MSHWRSPISRTTFENVWTNTNSPFGPKHDVLAQHLIFTEPDHIHWGIGACDCSKGRSRWHQNLGCRKKIYPPKKWPVGSKNGHFRAKTSSFGRNGDFVGPKIFKKIFVCFKKFFVRKCLKLPNNNFKLGRFRLAWFRECALAYSIKGGGCRGSPPAKASMLGYLYQARLGSI